MDASPLREDPAKARSRRSSREPERHLAESPRDSAAHHSPRDSAAHHVQDIRAVQAPSSATGALPALSGSLSLHEPAVASPQAPRSATGRLYCLDALRGLRGVARQAHVLASRALIVTSKDGLSSPLFPGIDP